MNLHILPAVFLRAPLLPAARLGRAGAALEAHPLGAAALALASPDLRAALGSRRRADAALALDRYGRRAAFRPTPAGLLAGVAVGVLAPRTAIATGKPRAWMRPSWAALQAIARALLDEPDVRPHVRLHVAPSLTVRAGVATWLHPDAGDEPGALAVQRLELDEVLAGVLSLCDEPRPWTDVRHLLAGLDTDREATHDAATHAAAHDEATHDAAALDDHIIAIIERGLLVEDLTPALVGPPPFEALRARVASLPERVQAKPLVRAALDHVAAVCAAVDVPAALDALERLVPAVRPALHAVLTLHAPRAPRVSRAAAERAAAVAPMLFALQEALAAPVAERDLDDGLLEALAGLVEVFGAGAFDVGSLVAGGYGVALSQTDGRGEAPAASPAVVAHLCGAVATAARAGADEIVLRAEDVAALVDLAPVPSTFELHLAPAREPARARAGTGWLLGLHAPAGASWGRFAEALGAPALEALTDLADAEAAVSGGATSVDVVYAPTPALGDLCAHPCVRPAALALTGWPAGAARVADDLELVSDPAAALPLVLRDHTGHVIVPRPLHRVRSTTAPPGMYRLLAGWSFARQHAPWAFSWGPLAGLPWLPRVVAEGFVVAPQSWAVPSDLRTPRAVAAWRKEARVPRWVQVGQGDELLPIDLERPDAAAEIARAGGARAHEIWPPLDRLVDEDGRRVELVLAVTASDADLGSAVAAAARAGAVPPPSAEPPAPGWTTWKLFGDEQRQDAVLLEAVGPDVRAALAAGEIDGWFFQRYEEGPGRRPHLRLRVRAAGKRGEAFGRRLFAQLPALRDAEDVVALESGPYFRETARYGGPGIVLLAERLFQLGSELVLDVLAADLAAHDAVEADRVELVVRACEAVARGLGLSHADRHALASRRRVAYEAQDDMTRLKERAAAFRGRARRLQALLGARQEDPFTAAFARCEAETAKLAKPLDAGTRAALLGVLAPVLHVNAVRLLGADAAGEADAFHFWDRTLEGLSARERRSRAK